MLLLSSIIFYLYLACINGKQIYTNEELNTSLYPTNNGVKLKIHRGFTLIASGTLGIGKNLSQVTCLGESSCTINDYSFTLNPREDGFTIKWESNNTDIIFQDCYDLLDGVQWYGGPETKIQKWPIQKLNISGDLPYVLRQFNSDAIAERYWLNSKGLYFYVESKVPLYVDQNMLYKNQVCFIAKVDGPYVNRKRNFLEYHIITKNNSKEAHLHAINNFLGKPTGHPNEKMITEPIWTTWAKYKKNINDKTVIEFASVIRNHGFEKGQLEIDDNWETCYGAQEFSSKNFPDISNTVKTLKKLNYRVTLWIHPFVNSDCQNNSNTGKEKEYFVQNTTKSIDGSWWDGRQAYQIDFTKPEAAQWWSDRLKKLQENPGIDSFKFDAGETDYGPQPAVYNNVDIEDVPNILTEKYIRTCSEFGDLIEFRSGSRTQDLPNFIRMIDKDSFWGDQNGLYTLITTLLQMNMNGYTMVLPDMIGGNGYTGVPNAELLVRWTQANTFMPSMQFSYLPWEITSDQYDVTQIVKKFVDLHEAYSGTILDAMKDCIENGTPVNPPIWFIDPNDRNALACDDEFLLGEKILVAPVIVEGARSRSVYLPKGEWKDGNNGTIYKGPITLNYNADISTLPYFILQEFVDML